MSGDGDLYGSAAPLISGPNNQVSNFELCDGESMVLSATGTPATSSAWTSSNSSVVSVNASTGEILG